MKTHKDERVNDEPMHAPLHEVVPMMRAASRASMHEVIRHIRSPREREVDVRDATGVERIRIREGGATPGRGPRRRSPVRSAQGASSPAPDDAVPRSSWYSPGMKIGIIGAGQIGSVLAHHLVKLGHTVAIANSRGPASLVEIAAKTGATAVTAHAAARAGEIVIVTIPQKAVAALPADLFAGVPATVVVIDTGNYYPELRDDDIAPKDGIDSEWVAAQLGRPVIKVFNNIFAQSLRDKASPPGTAGRLALPVAGDDAQAKQRVVALVEQIGFDAIDAGPLADSWRQQPGTPAYCHDFDRPRMVAALAAAQRDHTAQARAENEAHVRQITGKSRL